MHWSQSWEKGVPPQTWKRIIKQYFDLSSKESEHQFSIQCKQGSQKHNKQAIYFQLWQLYWTCHIFLPISPWRTENHELKAPLFPILFFSEHPSTYYSPKNNKSILAVVLQEHFLLQVYFWLSFPNQRRVVISSHFNMLVLHHRTQKGLKKKNHLGYYCPVLDSSFVIQYS